MSMKMNFVEFRKKVLFFAPIIAWIFVLHLIWVYIYEDGVSMWVRGGSINIGIVGTAPGIPNPLEYTKDKYNDLILKFLYRPLIRYDAMIGTYQWDIGTCDLADLSKIKCMLKKDQYWSDRTKIQVEDIVATYQAFRTRATNEKMTAFLKNVSIVSRGESDIEISAKEKNSLILDLLTYPIIRSDMIERIKTGRISHEGYITSGPYSFSGNEKNKEFGYERISIVRDEKNGGEGWLDKYNFLFFPDLKSLERSTDNLSIIIPPVKSEKIILSPRFDGYNYTMYEYIGLFANTDRLSSEVRRQLYGKIVESYSGAIDPNEKPIQNIFALNTQLEYIKLDKNLSDVMRSQGYMKPDESLALLSGNTDILTGSSVDYGNTQYFTLPTPKKIFFSEIAGAEMILSGNIPITTEKVYINGYALQEYLPGNAKFVYKVSLANRTLQEWKNVYTLELEQNGQRSVKDAITIYYAPDSTVLKKLQEDVDQEYLRVLNSPDKVDARKKIGEKAKEKLRSLDPRYYYNAKREPFEVKIAYKNDPLSLERYANTLSNALQSLSIKSSLAPLSTKDLQKMLETGTKNYDYILIGFEANGRLSRVGQVFLSTEAKNGINFSKIESKKLDALFASLRVASGKLETESVQKDILNYIQSEWFFLALSSPIHTLYIDKNLKWVTSIAKFQDISTLHGVLRTASIKDAYVIKTGGKWIFAFFSWIIEKAFPKN